MSSAEITTLARRFVVEHNQAGYLASFDELLAPDCIVHEYLPVLPDALDRAGYNQFIAAFRSAIPDIHNQIEDVIAGCEAAWRYASNGTSRESFTTRKRKSAGSNTHPGEPCLAPIDR